jgi:hypothetical protein
MEEQIMPPERQCTRCLVNLPATLEHFPPHKPGKYGMHSRCRPCKKLDDAERRNRPDQVKRQQEWRDKNKQKIKQYNIEYRAAGYKSTLHSVPWAKHKYRTDPAFNLTVKARAAVRSLVKRKGISSGGGSSRYLQFSRNELMLHLERQFVGGMSWDRFLAGEIHIDHITPVAAFDIKELGDSEFMACWSLANLRPIWASENLMKSDSLDFLL